MASKFLLSLALFLVLNLVFFNPIVACGGGSSRGGGGGGIFPTPSPARPSPCNGGSSGGGNGSGSDGNGGSGGGGGGGGGSDGNGGGSNGRCPRDALKLGVCANVLNGLINVTVGTPPREPCCPLIEGLADLEVAVCLCTAVKANVLGVNISLPIDLSLLINYCGRRVPRGFQCS